MDLLQELGTTNQLLEIIRQAGFTPPAFKTVAGWRQRNAIPGRWAPSVHQLWRSSAVCSPISTRSSFRRRARSFVRRSSAGAVVSYQTRMGRAMSKSPKVFRDESRRSLRPLLRQEGDGPPRPRTRARAKIREAIGTAQGRTSGASARFKRTHAQDPARSTRQVDGHAVLRRVRRLRLDNLATKLG